MIIDQNSAVIDPNTYRGLAALTVQDYTEINSKNGTQWETQILFTGLQTDVAQTFSFTTGSQPVLIKRREISGEFSRITYEIFTDASVTGGTTVPVGNMSDRNPQLGEVSIKMNPTVTSVGTLWSPMLTVLGSAANKSYSSYGMNHGERVLKENTTYLIRVTDKEPTPINYLTIDLSYYEGPLDLDLRATDPACP